MAEPRLSAEDLRKNSARLLLVGLASSSAFGLLALIAAQQGGKIGAFGVGCLIFLAAAAVGGGLGFLFAVPRVLSEGGASADPDRGDKAAGESPAGDDGETRVQSARARFQRRMLRSNTNLERISDWLTTMLVGVGLSQINNVPGSLVAFSQFLGGLSLCKSGCETTNQVLATVGPMVLVFGLGVGFLFFYLYTRLVIVTMLNAVEQVIDGTGDLAEIKVEDPAAVAATVAAAKQLDAEQDDPTFKAVAKRGAPSIKESISVMNGLLYIPGNYEKVIELGDQLRSTKAADAPHFWVYQAAAFGQKYTALKQAGGTEAQLKDVRDRALDCVHRALAIRPNYRGWLARLTNPAGEDDDLKDLRNDPELIEILKLD